MSGTDDDLGPNFKELLRDPDPSVRETAVRLLFTSEQVRTICTGLVLVYDNDFLLTSERAQKAAPYKQLVELIDLFGKVHPDPSWLRRFRSR